MTNNERVLIWSAVRCALVFGHGPLTASQEAIEDEGIEWAEAHEREACRAIDELNEELGRPPKEN
jgi:hypothetical protein